jgi:hypothetical protein
MHSIEHTPDPEAFVETTNAQRAEIFFREMLGLDTSNKNIRLVKHLEDPRKKGGLKLYACKQ